VWYYIGIVRKIICTTIRKIQNLLTNPLVYFNVHSNATSTRILDDPSVSRYALKGVRVCDIGSHPQEHFKNGLLIWNKPQNRELHLNFPQELSEKSEVPSGFSTRVHLHMSVCQVLIWQCWSTLENLTFY
jgi:hypothetical protein